MYNALEYYDSRKDPVNCYSSGVHPDIGTAAEVLNFRKSFLDISLLMLTGCKLKNV